MTHDSAIYPTCRRGGKTASPGTSNRTLYSTRLEVPLEVPIGGGALLGTSLHFYWTSDALLTLQKCRAARGLPGLQHPIGVLKEVRRDFQKYPPLKNYSADLRGRSG